MDGAPAVCSGKEGEKRLFKYSIQTIVQQFTCIANTLQNISNTSIIRKEQLSQQTL